MLLSKFVYTKIAPSNVTHWKDLGYDVGSIGRRNSDGLRLRVRTEHLKPNSNHYVCCRCDECDKKYIIKYSKNQKFCSHCANSRAQMNNKGGYGNKGKRVPKLTGENHPRWNPSKKALTTYGRAVHWHSHLTYKANKHIINPNDHPRGRCGVEGAYQLDHIVSIKKCFEENWPIEKAASVENLQMLPWKDNRNKW
jgi:hypothetical protein